MGFRSECLLFGGLISTFLLYKDRAVDGPVPHEPLRHRLHVDLVVRAADEPRSPWCSLSGHLPRRPALRAWLLVTALLGSIFISVRSTSSAEFFNEDWLHHQPGRLRLLHAHRLPRRARHHRDRPC
ncbi:MAG: hypothetical protein R2746_14680 [Acidimicrobiales bacterium]